MLIDGSRRRWELTPADRDLVREIVRSAGLTEPTAETLARRGVGSAEEAHRLLEPDVADLPDARLLPDADRVVARVGEALDRSERIVVHGHDDADGVNASVAMIDVLRDLGADVHSYIPDRRTEGHGLNTVEIDGLAAAGTKLIITVDSCVSEVDNIAYANALGMDVIVTDHHEIPPALPDAVAIVNAKLPDSPYPYRYMAGAGVAWRVAGLLREELKSRQIGGVPAWRGERWHDEALALAAIGSVADRVPLTGDNRVIVTEGLRVLPQTVRPGLRALLEETGLAGRAVDHDEAQEHLGSAFGRVSDGRGHNTAYEMLDVPDPEEARRLARRLVAIRQEWRSRASSAWKAVERAAAGMDEGAPVIIVEASVPIAVMGYATSKLAQQTGKPCLLIVSKNGEAHAEARGPAGYNFVVAFQAMDDLFLGYGGHPRAAGFSIESERVPEFRERMLAHADEHPPEPVPRRVDAELPLEAATARTAEELARLAPFGQAWGRPVMLARDVTSETMREAERNGLRWRTPTRVSDRPVDILYRLSVADDVLFASELDRVPEDGAAAPEDDDLIDGDGPESVEDM